MRILLWAEQAKMRRSRTLWIAGFATAMVAMIVVLQGQFLYHGSRYIDGAYWLMTAAQSLGSIYVLPAMIALIGSYTICRERQEDTQKALDMIPVSQVQLLGAKMIWTGAFAIILYISLFCVAAAVEAVLHVQALSLGGILEQVKIYILQGFFLFVAVAPIVALVARMQKSYWLALLFAEVYSFLALFAGMNGLLRSLYPITAAFCLSGYYEATLPQMLLSALSMAGCAGTALILLKREGRRER